ncbi:MAG: phytase [Steroidobacter sp.]
MLKRHSALLLAALAALCAATSQAAEVQAVRETPPSLDYDDEERLANADDPAIWVNPDEDDQDKSLVVATLKEGGIDVYNLQGMLLQHIPGLTAANPDHPRQRFNNVDLVYGFRLGSQTVDLAVATDRGFDRLAIFRINKNGSDAAVPLTEVTQSGLPFVFAANQDEVNDELTVMGIGSARLENGQTIAFVTRNDRAEAAKFRLYDAGGGKVGYAPLVRFNLPSQFTLPNGQTWTPCQDEDGLTPMAEGTVIDREEGYVYIGQEAVGLWRTTLNNPGANLQLIDKVDTFGVPYTRTFDEEEEEYVCEFLFEQDPGFGGRLTRDVEGVTLYEADDEEGYVIVSSQGANEYLVYERDDDNDYIGRFSIVDGMVDGTQETDGIGVSNADFGSPFGKGLFVAMDGGNTPDILDEEGEPVENTNFKFVRWRDIADQLDLIIDEEHDIRDLD